MTLREAIDILTASYTDDEFTPGEIATGNWGDKNANAIATILNAVVKGELKYVES